MAKATPFNIGITEQNSEFMGVVGEVLNQEHGVHGLKFVENEHPDIVDKLDLIINLDSEMVEFRYLVDGGDSEIVEHTHLDNTEIQRALSSFALRKLGLKLPDQSSRHDIDELKKYIGPRPNLEPDPSEWITGNQLIGDLVRRHAQYGNLIRYVCNERGLFLKVGNYPKERAYWNSSLNGGLPVYKKSDPIHEGTFMLHDILHYVPVDPIIGSAEDSAERKAAYIAHRMLSEACTLVLADMVAIRDAELEGKGYDVSKRRIYPVYDSIVNDSGKIPEVDKLLAANAYFCFTGDVSGFRELGAREDVLAVYQAKYESVFRDDFQWNLDNYETMIEERDSNISVQEYYNWLESHGNIRSLSDLDQVIDKTQGGLDIAKLLSLFRGDFKTAFAYQTSMDDIKRLRTANGRYLAGQRMVFARFASKCNPDKQIDNFDAIYDELMNADDSKDISELAKSANAEIDEYIDRLTEKDLLLPHEEVLYRFSVPTYPIRLVNYDRNNLGVGATFQDKMREFMHSNEASLQRVLQATQ